MTVARILAVKGRDVISTQPHRTLREVAALLSEKNIGAVLVSGADGQILGILSERDIVCAIASGGAGALEDAVSRHMTARVTTATRDTHVDEIMECMTQGRFRHVPIVEKGELLGIISIGDVVKHRIAEIEHEAKVLKDYIATA